MKNILIYLMLQLFLSTSLWAVEPDEILADTDLEKKARLISKDLRCLVCQNENIDSSNAELARDLRLLVRERLLLGDSHKEVVAYIVNRYGDFVLLKPRFSGKTLILWFIGPIVFLFSLCILLIVHRQKQKVKMNKNPKLNDEEKKELAAYFKHH
jgi:cytochrome c-type biogenesis protein CcmH